MPENEFEKKISSELQGLRFKPSEPVWMKVEERIRKKKKRRVAIIFFLFAGIALLGYWQWDNFFGGEKQTTVKNETIPGKKNNSNDVVTQNDNKENKPDNNLNEINKDVSTNKEIDKKAEKNKTVAKTETITDQKSIAVQSVSQKKRSAIAYRKEKVVSKKKSRQTEKKEIMLTGDDLAILEYNNRMISEYEKANNDIKNERTDKKQSESVTIKNSEPKIDSAIKIDPAKKDSVAKTINSLNVDVADSPAVSLPKKKVNKKWSFGIEFTPGVSSYNEDLFSFNANKSADLNSVPAPGNTFTADPAKTNPGFGFQLGGFVKKQLTRRSSLNIGLRWTYYSDKLHIGPVQYPTTSSAVFSQTLDRLGTSYAFRASGSGTYKEKYHFLELPVTYNVQLNKSTTHPYSLALGFKIGKLLSSNAIAYDTAANGIYYSSTKYLNKTQFGFVTGFNWGINNSNKMKINIGPVFDFHLNSLVDNPFDKKKYLLFTGIRTSVLFNSKN